jgi:hypothetical protein
MIYLTLLGFTSLILLLHSTGYNASSNTVYVNFLLYCYQQLVECIWQLEPMKGKL